jgi:hypothetical protein
MWDKTDEHAIANSNYHAYKSEIFGNTTETYQIPKQRFTENNLKCINQN